jgi:hypothetical protein
MSLLLLIRDMLVFRFIWDKEEWHNMSMSATWGRKAEVCDMPLALFTVYR